MEKNLILAIVLSTAFLLVYYTFLQPSPPAVPPPVLNRTASSANTGDSASSAAQVSAAAATETLTNESIFQKIEEETRPISALERVTLSNGSISMGFIKDWGNLSDWRLKKFNESDTESVNLLKTPGYQSTLPLKLDVVAGGETVVFGLPEITEPAPGRLDFIFRGGALTVTKSFFLEKDKYAVDFGVKIENTSGDKVVLDSIALSWVNFLAGAEADIVKKSDIAMLNSIYSRGGQVKTLSMAKKSSGFMGLFGKKKQDTAKEVVTDIGNNNEWVGFEDRYFALVIFQDKAAVNSVEFRQNMEKGSFFRVSYKGVAVEPGTPYSLKYRIFGGPKDYAVLKEYGIEKLGSMGFFSPLARLMISIMKFFYSIFGNYGIAIIMLTLIVKIILYPLNHISLKSMREMQQLQPHIEELKKKFKNSKDKLNAAMMELYKERKVNPLSGCLPILIQLPIFIALYSALQKAVELRRADFMFWINDLSVADPLYIMPILMGISMFAQQKMSVTDPRQAQMAYMMPVIFTVFFINLPSGLVLYWFVQNLLSIAQQYYVNKKYHLK